jgi:hypothetical protein
MASGGTRPAGVAFDFKIRLPIKTVPPYKHGGTAILNQLKADNIPQTWGINQKSDNPM